MSADSVIVVGVDVGGPRKGFHAVALRGGDYWDKFESRQADRIAAWCRQMRARVVGIDAPCKWSPGGRAREAERALMRQKIWCFSTPTREAAVTHHTNHYGWMLAGEELYAVLSETHRLLDGRDGDMTGPIMFETFPQAAVCGLLGRVVSAKSKREVRLRLLQDHGIAVRELTNIDLIDAGLCALTARFVVAGATNRYGDEAGGYIVVPRVPDMQGASL